MSSLEKQNVFFAILVHFFTKFNTLCVLPSLRGINGAVTNKMDEDPLS
jgi:hypothetical protein